MTIPTIHTHIYDTYDTYDIYDVKGVDAIDDDYFKELKRTTYLSCYVDLFPTTHCHDIDDISEIGEDRQHRRRHRRHRRQTRHRHAYVDLDDVDAIRDMDATNVIDE